ncbi:MAG: hypothetical protein COZ69_13070 [Deltaproteobacteria bacterium CG_4_8_14_3_um_filter_45_9]|nr:MAG: hypothetical protein COS40_06685 [Deltaproteobacteria bacterium CG03_land_8_20_14_0_80_45_14]PIX21765.1 MAG: hypothetical protein COZ69_13070 [Deltaproteobacteria bacterium CG_4_8_14_3_um_filter_45_9]
MIKRYFLFSALLVVLFSPFCLVAEEYKFDLSEIEKKPYHIGGYLEFRPVLFGLDRDASLYKLKFFKRDEGKTIEEYNGKLQIEGSYEKGIARLFVRTNFDLTYSYLGWEHNEPQRMIYEGYLSLKPTPSLSFKFGKQILLWGKGYAFNPVAFVSRGKDPDDPELALEGFIAASADYIKSFNGPLKTLSITPVILPVYEHINDDFGKVNKLNFAGKLYLLLYDTDIDLIAMTAGSRTSRVGMDFSKNITTNLEIHGEFAFINNQRKKVIDSLGKISESKFDAKNYLLGIRYLTASDTTFIFEYYRNGTGFSHLEMKDYFTFIDKGYDLFLSKRNESLLKKAASVTQGNYGRPNPMKDYLYLRVTQKEPFNILYFTPAITTIMNLNDKTLSLSPELLYTGFTNWEFRLKGTALVGQRETEFGEKQNDYRLELRVRFYF